MIRSLTVVIPAHDEALALAETLPRVVDGLASAMAELEVLVVDDGSTDGTSQVVRELEARYPCVACVVHDRNEGKGRALRTGFARARHEWVLFVDADHQVRIDELGPIAARARHADAVIGYRTRRRDGAGRAVISTAYRLLTRLFLGVKARDVNCPFKLFRRELIQSLPLASDGFLIDAEILHVLRRRGIAIEEVPVVWHPRLRGASTVRWRHLPELVRELVRLRARAHAGTLPAPARALRR